MPTALKYLADEQDVTEFHTGDQSFKLTNQRLVFEGESKRLLIFPGGRVFVASFLEDVTVAFLGRKHILPTWTGVFGAVGVLAGFVVKSPVAIIVGAVLSAAWYFLGATVLEFRVAGEPLATVSTASFGEVDGEMTGARTFVDSFSQARENRVRHT